MIFFPVNERRAVRLGIFSSRKDLSFAAVGLGILLFGCFVLVRVFFPHKSLSLDEALSFLESVCVKNRPCLTIHRLLFQNKARCGEEVWIRNTVASHFHSYANATNVRYRYRLRTRVYCRFYNMQSGLRAPSAGALCRYNALPSYHCNGRVTSRTHREALVCWPWDEWRCGWALAPEANTIMPFLKLIKEHFYQRSIRLEPSSSHVLCHVLYGADINMPRPCLK